ncbi:pentatricopeptide repeat-containing protein, mitochondrial [Trifolium repens]|nr:pentatricopeptide repeat-containing protein, mitochondrial [Trifolium repens]
MGETNEALRVFENMGERDVVSWSSVVGGLCRDGKVGYARILFDRMPERNVVSWSAMIDGYMEKPRKIHGLVSRLGFEFGCTNMGKKVFCAMGKKDLVSWNSMISGYIYNNEVDAANVIFKKMPEKDLISWMAMISGFAKDGRIGKAIELFNILKEKDEFVWTVIISGFVSVVSNEEYEETLCRYVWMNREGCRPNPVTISNIEPEVDHYACMVDLLRRACLLDEAIDLIRSMRLKLHSGVWGALLAAGQKIEGDLVRKMKNLKGIKKSPGLIISTARTSVLNYLPFALPGT